MKQWIKCKAGDAVLKTLALAAVLHVVLLIVAAFVSVKVSTFSDGLKVFWPHFESTGSIVVTLVLVVVLYLIFYFTSKEK